MLFRFLISILVLGSLGVDSALAATTAHCTITKAEASPFEIFVGGSISIDLKTGNNYMVSLEVDGHRFENVTIGNERLSSQKTDRTTCTHSTTQKFSRANELRIVTFDFYDCEVEHAPDQLVKSTLSVTQSVDLEKKEGVYQEAFSGDDNEWNIFRLKFSNCSIN